MSFSKKLNDAEKGTPKVPNEKPVDQVVAELRTKRIASDESNVSEVAKKSQFFKTRSCPWLSKGFCIRGDSCNFAHSPAELRPSPDLSRTKLCHMMLNGKRCPKSRCRFAHSANDLRATDAFYKTSMCPMWLSGECRSGEFCRMAHGKQELRHNPMFGKREEKKAGAEEEEKTSPTTTQPPKATSGSNKSRRPPPRLSSVSEEMDGFRGRGSANSRHQERAKPSPCFSDRTQSTRASPQVTPQGGSEKPRFVRYDESNEGSFDFDFYEPTVVSTDPDKANYFFYDETHHGGGNHHPFVFSNDPAAGNLKQCCCSSAYDISAPFLKQTKTHRERPLQDFHPHFPVVPLFLDISARCCHANRQPNRSSILLLQHPSPSAYVLR